MDSVSSNFLDALRAAVKQPGANVGVSGGYSIGWPEGSPQPRTDFSNSPGGMTGIYWQIEGPNGPTTFAACVGIGDNAKPALRLAVFEGREDGRAQQWISAHTQHVLSAG